MKQLLILLLVLILIGCVNDTKSKQDNRGKADSGLTKADLKKALD